MAFNLYEQFLPMLNDNSMADFFAYNAAKKKADTAKEEERRADSAKSLIALGMQNRKREELAAHQAQQQAMQLYAQQQKQAHYAETEKIQRANAEINARLADARIRNMFERTEILRSGKSGGKKGGGDDDGPSNRKITFRALDSRDLINQREYNKYVADYGAMKALTDRVKVIQDNLKTYKPGIFTQADAANWWNKLGFGSVDSKALAERTTREAAQKIAIDSALQALNLPKTQEVVHIMKELLTPASGTTKKNYEAQLATLVGIVDEHRGKVLSLLNQREIKDFDDDIKAALGKNERPGYVSEVVWDMLRSQPIGAQYLSQEKEKETPGAEKKERDIMQIFAGLNGQDMNQASQIKQPDGKGKDRPVLEKFMQLFAGGLGGGGSAAEELAEEAKEADASNTDEGTPQYPFEKIFASLAALPKDVIKGMAQEGTDVGAGLYNLGRKALGKEMVQVPQIATKNNAGETIGKIIAMIAGGGPVLKGVSKGVSQIPKIGPKMGGKFGQAASNAATWGTIEGVKGVSDEEGIEKAIGAAKLSAIIDGVLGAGGKFIAPLKNALGSQRYKDLTALGEKYNFKIDEGTKTNLPYFKRDFDYSSRKPMFAGKAMRGVEAISEAEQKLENSLAAGLPRERVDLNTTVAPLLKEIYQDTVKKHSTGYNEFFSSLGDKRIKLPKELSRHVKDAALRSEKELEAIRGGITPEDLHFLKSDLTKKYLKVQERVKNRVPSAGDRAFLSYFKDNDMQKIMQDALHPQDQQKYQALQERFAKELVPFRRSSTVQKIVENKSGSENMQGLIEAVMKNPDLLRLLPQNVRNYVLLGLMNTKQVYNPGTFHKSLTAGRKFDNKKLKNLLTPDDYNLFQDLEILSPIKTTYEDILKPSHTGKSMLEHIMHFDPVALLNLVAGKPLAHGALGGLKMHNWLKNKGVPLPKRKQNWYGILNALSQENKEDEND